MATSQVKRRLLKRLDELSPDQEGRVLDFVERMTRKRRGVSGKELLRFSGVIDKQSAEEMKAAIEEGCERGRRRLLR